MTKFEQLIEFQIQDLVAMIVEDSGMEFDEAMRLFYGSEVFRKLQDSGTGLYAESPAYVYELFNIEQKFGQLIQMEY